MDWELYTQHLICGYIPMILLLLAYFFVLFSKGKKHLFTHSLFTFGVCFYLLGILTVTGIWQIYSFSPTFVLIPFVDMLGGLRDTFLNIILFIPLGFILPMIYTRFRDIIVTVVTGLLVSLSVEVIQMFGCGITDINDLITNMLGSFLGYCAYLFLYNIIPDRWKKMFLVEKIRGDYEFYFLWVLSLFIMIAVQPNIFNFLFDR